MPQKSYVEQFKHFLLVQNLPKIEDITIEDLNDILFNFYSSIKPQKKTDYSVQTLKCFRSGLIRFFKKERGIDIATDPMFVKANEMFEAVKVNATKEGHGIKKSIPPISEINLERIADYFYHDHVTALDPKRLQQNMPFYIVYFCQCGRQNLYSMKRDTFKLVVEADGTEYYIQDVNKIDKNHIVDDPNKTNQSHMLATNSKYIKNF